MRMFWKIFKQFYIFLNNFLRIVGQKADSPIRVIYSVLIGLAD